MEVMVDICLDTFRTKQEKTVMDCLEFDSVHSQVLEGCLQKKKHILTNCDAK